MDLKAGPQYFSPDLVSIEASQDNVQQWKGDILIYGISEEEIDSKTDKNAPKIASGKLQYLSQENQVALKEILEFSNFRGSKGSYGYSKVKGNSMFVGFVGIGKEREDVSSYLKFGDAAAKLARELKVKSVALAIEENKPSSTEAVEALVRGFSAQTFQNQAFKSKDNPSVLQKIQLLGFQDKETAVKRANSIVKGTILARCLVDAPPNVCTPTFIAESAKYIQNSYSNFEIEILEQEQCEKLGLGAYLAVAKGSDEPLKLIHLTYKGKNASKKIAIVGKGLTFDSGGYNIKAGAGSLIEIMKIDMGGAAATFGAAKIIGELQPDNIEVHFISASCENMINGKAYRPGDVLKAANGKTIEVNNTDAEGRLTLADALWFAQEQAKVSKVVDAATLTGACMVALGPKIGGLYSTSEALAKTLQSASTSTGEKLWRMPIEDSYFEQLKSNCADMKNTGGRMGGSITATLFLKEYVDTEKVEWAHLDIPGPVYEDATGGTGYGAAVLADWVIKESQN